MMKSSNDPKPQIESAPPQSAPLDVEMEKAKAESPVLKSVLRNLPFAALVVVYLVLWLGGVGSHVVTGRTPAATPWAAPLFLALAGVMVLLTTDGKNRLSLLVVALLGFLAEVVGVRYAFLFSAYQYTDALQPQLLGVPLVMMGAWVALFAYVKQMLLPFRFPLFVESLIASFWMTSIDAVIDPLAAGNLNYWRWQQAGSYYGIPAQNFLGWFLVSLILFNLVRVKWRRNPWAHYVGISIILFFSFIALAHRMLLVFVIGAILCVVDWMVIYSKREVQGASQ